VSYDFLRDARKWHDDAALLSLVMVLLSDGSEETGRIEINNVYMFAAKTLLEAPETDASTLSETVLSCDTPTLAQLFFFIHIELLQRSSEWRRRGRSASAIDDRGRAAGRTSREEDDA